MNHKGHHKRKKKEQSSIFSANYFKYTKPTTSVTTITVKGCSYCNFTGTYWNKPCVYCNKPLIAPQEITVPPLVPMVDLESKRLFKDLDDIP